MLQITFPSTSAYYQFTTPIQGSTYILEMQWMDRTSMWYMSVYDSNSNLIVPNLTLVPNFPLLYQKVSIEFEGDFLVVPTTTATEITQDNITSSWALVYLTEDEISGE